MPSQDPTKLPLADKPIDPELEGLGTNSTAPSQLERLKALGQKLDYLTKVVAKQPAAIPSKQTYTLMYRGSM